MLLFDTGVDGAGRGFRERVVGFLGWREVGGGGVEGLGWFGDS